MSGPAVFFAHELRLARETAGFTQESLAGAVNFSASLIAMVESCKRTPTADFCRAIDDALDTGGRFDRIRQDLLVPEVRPEWFKPWLGYEAEATEVRWFEPLVVPGLWQTEAYARQLLGDDERVTARLERQSIRDRAEVTAIVDEHVLHRRIGDAKVMAEQLEVLAESAVYVLPADADTYWPALGSFALARVDSVEVAYLDTQARGFVLEDPGVTSTLRDRWEAIATEALPRGLSAAKLKEVGEAWNSSG